MRVIPALARALDTLELFLDPRSASQGLTVPEMIKALGLPRTTAHEIVNTLAVRDYLSVVPGDSRRYRLGVLPFHLGRTYADTVDLPSFGDQVAREVSAACDETVHVAVLDRADAVYVAKADSTNVVRMVSGVGRRVPANCTAVGKMLLSALTPEALSAIYPPGQLLPAMTPRSITNLARLYSELDQIRENGYSIEECESNEGVACVAAPVYDVDSMVAALSISVPMTRWPGREHLEELSALVRSGAQRLSTRLGAPAPPSLNSAGTDGQP